MVNENDRICWKANSRRWKLALFGSFFLWGLWTVGLFIDDRNRTLAGAFYFPSVLALGWCAFMAMVGVHYRWKAVVALNLVLAVFPLASILFWEHQWSRPQVLERPDEAPVYRLAHWNVNRGSRGWESTLKTMAGVGGDINVISEVKQVDGNRDRVEKIFGPGYEYRSFANLAVVARGEVGLARHHPTNAGRIYSIECTLDEGPTISMVIVDFPSSIESRHPLLVEARKVTAELKPHFLIGDFNAPRNSYALRRMPEGYRHSYEAAGAGWSYTWPVPIALLDVDHCYMGPTILPVTYQLHSSFYSDHRLQQLDFWVKPSGS